MTYIGTCDFSSLPDGSNLVPAMRVASAIDVSVTNATVDFIEFEVQRQKAIPRDFGFMQVPLPGSQLELTPAGMTITPRDAGAGVPVGKVSYSDLSVTLDLSQKPRALHRMTLELPSAAGSDPGSTEYQAVFRKMVED